MKIKLWLLLGVVIIPIFLLSQASIDVIIPKPQKILRGEGQFLLTNQTGTVSDTPLSINAMLYLQKQLKYNAGYLLQSGKTSQANTLHFHYAPQKIKKSEAYHLSIDKTQITIEARDEAGFFYAVISLMQLMSPAIWGASDASWTLKKWAIPSCEIEDYPRFEWRGVMLDSSRNFFSKAYVKKFIDRMAQQKLNRFHWHLTDDEGWRIEIKRYPLLTQIGARRGPGTKLPFSIYPAMRGAKNRVQSGYYTQQDIKEIVAYAKARSIEILPEINIPGHAKAAVTAYPDLLLDPQDKSHYRSVQLVSNNTINPALESSYVFLDHIITEVAALFPFGSIHLGGDEIPEGAWQKSPAVKELMQKEGFKTMIEVQNWFFGRMDTILANHHRSMIAWQEVLQGKPILREEDSVMAWKSAKDGIHAIKQNRNAIMAPVEYLYFDQQYSRSLAEPGHTWSTPVSTQKVYEFHPGSNTSHLRGVQACLWSETLLNEKIADYLAWPRTFALAEVAWTEEKNRNWNTFKKRAYGKGLERLKVQNITYRKEH